MELSRRLFLRHMSAAGVISLVRPESSWASSSAISTEPADHATHVEGLTPHTLVPVPIEQVTIQDEFWTPKREVWQSVTIRDCFRKFENDRGGAINNFDKVRDGKSGGHAGDPWMDGLVYEMIRGASDFMRSHPDPELDRQLDGYIARIAAAAAKDPNGYINTYTQLMEPGHRWGLNGGLQIWQHEVYNLGCLVDAGVHHYRATGKTTLLVVGIKIANYMYEFMGPAPKRNIVPCHELPEEALIGLYELFVEQPALKKKISLPVDESNYLALAEFWIENRGNNIGKPDWEKNRQAAEQFVRDQKYGSGRPSWGEYAQDDKSVFSQDTIHGHAVRATLLCSGIATAARVNGREEYRQAASRLWENMVLKRMYITGGVGSVHTEERFGPNYTLPNDGYLETCAAVGSGFFHQNMNSAFGDARYADELERALYNGVLSGVSIKGDSYFYQNPLEADTDRSRWAWHECPCCPPMFLKMMGAMPGYIYATDNDSAYINLFVGSRATLKVNGENVVLRQTTQYPWDGAVRIAVEASHPKPFNLMLRIPQWCGDAVVKVNGQSVLTSERVRGYVRIHRTWQKGDAVELAMAMPARFVAANPLVQADAGRVALMRGPLVYCLESADNGIHTRTLALGADQKLSTELWPDKLGRVMTIKGTAAIPEAKPRDNALYTGAAETAATSQPLTAIPYYSNANRGPVEMAVWIPLKS
ncbi:MAG: glycoside hydrolase family 127 protein [Acidobacteriales bacterium]|nr:glycoside hydrolase family 127 protein [Terriglobales bacterium]